MKKGSTSVQSFTEFLPEIGHGDEKLYKFQMAQEMFKRKILGKYN